MKTIKNVILRVIEIIILISGLILLNTVAAPCLNDKAMKCNAATKSVELLFIDLIIIAVIGIIFAIKNKNHISTGLNMVSSILIVNIFLLPSCVIGGCMKLDMACRVKTYPCIYLIGIILIVLHLILFIIESKKGVDSVED